MITWTIIAIVFYRGNISTFSSTTYNSLVLIGGYIFILGAIFIIKNIKLKSTATLLILSLAWILLSYLYAWLWRPELYLTTNRYLIVGAAGAAIFLSGLISLGNSKRNQITIFVIFASLLIMHIYSTRMYEYQLISFGHGQEISNKIWASIPYMPEISKKENRPQLRLLRPVDKARFIRQYKNSKKRLIILDYDGTLLPLVKYYYLARPSTDLIETIYNLSILRHNLGALAKLTEHQPHCGARRMAKISGAILGNDKNF